MPSVASKHKEALTSVASANLALRQRLETNHRMIEAAIQLIRSGSSPTEVLGKFSIYEAESAANELATELFHARQQLRKVVVGAAIDDGVPAERLATEFHVPVGLISSYSLDRSNRS
jgi:hypothetical protein